MTKDTKPKIGDQNAETGELIYRAMNDVEFTQYEIDKANSEKLQAEAESKAARRQEILEKLGLTNDEAQLLLG